VNSGTYCDVTENYLSRPYSIGFSLASIAAGWIVALAAPCAAAPWQVGTPNVPRLYGYRPADYDGPVEEAISISAARREIEPFMLYVVTLEGPASDVSVSVSALTHQQTEAMIGAEHVEVAPLAYVKTSTAGSSDPSLAGERMALGRRDADFEPRILRRDIRRFDVPTGCQQAVWVNVEVPADAHPGNYRGTVTVRAADRTVEMPLKLHVHRFQLPEQPSLSGWAHWSGFTYDRQRLRTYDFTVEELDRVMRMMLRYRWRATRIYQKQNDSSPLPDVDLVRRWAAQGATDINLLRLDVPGAAKGLTRTDPETGKLVYTDAVFNHWWALLDQRVDRIQEADLFNRCIIYGFDERPRREVTAMDDAFRRVKQRYGNIPTMAASYIWTALDYPQLEHVDRMGYVTRLLSPKLRDVHHERGQEIYWYNLSRAALVPARVQFWATFKDDLDGLLFYNMRAEASILFAADEPFPLIDQQDLAPLHHLPDGPTSTTILEMWREGFDDVDYLHLLRVEVERVRRLGAEHNGSESVQRLLALADYYGSVPDSVTAGKLAEADVIRRYHRSMWELVGEEETYALQAEMLARLETDSMAHVIHVRDRIAELIEQLSAVTTNDADE